MSGMTYAGSQMQLTRDQVISIKIKEAWRVIKRKRIDQRGFMRVIIKGGEHA